MNTMKAYILKGDPAEVEKVIRENRIRISRGVITITPVDATETEAGTTFEPETNDTKEVSAVDTKETVVPKKRTKKSE